MNFSIKCAKCGCAYNSKPLVIETGELTKEGNPIYKAVGEDNSCPQCGFGSTPQSPEKSESLTGEGKKLLCD